MQFDFNATGVTSGKTIVEDEFDVESDREETDISEDEKDEPSDDIFETETETETDTTDTENDGDTTVPPQR